MIIQTPRIIKIIFLSSLPNTRACMAPTGKEGHQSSSLATMGMVLMRLQWRRNDWHLSSQLVLEQPAAQAWVHMDVKTYTWEFTLHNVQLSKAEMIQMPVDWQCHMGASLEPGPYSTCHTKGGPEYTACSPCQMWGEPGHGGYSPCRKGEALIIQPLCVLSGERPEHRECSPSPYRARTGTVMALQPEGMSQSHSGLTETPIHTKGIQLKEMGRKTRRTTSWFEVFEGVIKKILDSERGDIV